MDWNIERTGAKVGSSEQISGLAPETHKTQQRTDFQVNELDFSA
jgi:hypothetical protein